MKKLTGVIALLFVVSSGLFSQSSSSPNILSATEQSAGWKLLFDGKTKNGWHVFNNKTDGSAWKVDDGVLYLDPKAKGPKGEGGGDIISEEEFENFHLMAEWKIDSGANSGVIIQAQEDPKYRYAWVTGPEIQIIDNERHADAKKQKAPSRRSV